MKNKILVLIFSVCTSSAFAGGSFGVGNGGDIIRCPVDQNYYSLDFILTKNLLGKDVQIVKTNSFQDSMSRIERLIAQKLPSLKKSFNEYVMSLNNTSDTRLPYIWQNRRNLDDMNDEEYFRPPTTCQFVVGPPVEVYQAIIRLDVGNSSDFKIHFLYDADVIALLNNNVQRSFLYVHEWLWNFTKTANQNRKLNYFIHSTAFESATAEEAEKYFNSTLLK